MNNNCADYYTIACNDYDFVSNMLGMGYYNNTVVILQQVVVKLLKSILIDFDILCSSKVLHTHNLVTLYSTICDNIEVPFDLDIELLRKISNFYFSCRYPGDSYIWASEANEQDAINLVNETFDFVETLRRNE